MFDMTPSKSFGAQSVSQPVCELRPPKRDVWSGPVQTSDCFQMTIGVGATRDETADDHYGGGRVSRCFPMASDVLVALLLFCTLASAERPRSALYPAALQPKPGAPWLLNPSFQQSAEDVELLFEILLSGMEIRGQEPLVIPDPELASLRGARALELICDDVLPKSLPDVLRLSARLDGRRRPLSAPDFERTVLTLVYAAQTAAAAADGTERRLAWARSLVRLFEAIRKDLDF